MRWAHRDDIQGASPLAVHHDGFDRRASPERRSSIRHVVVHQTGATIIKRAVEEGEEPIQYALDYYLGRDTSVHYLGAYDGRLHQMTDDHLQASHVGVSTADSSGRPSERTCYLDGSWADGALAYDAFAAEWLGPISAATVARWRRAWPHRRSPQHLFKTRAINNVAVGIEFPPCRYRTGSGWKYIADPLRDGLGHTYEQHLLAAALLVDVGARWEWPTAWFAQPHRLLGHEDVDLYGRSNAAGGWDPGALRASPWWDWDLVRRTVAVLRGER